MAPVGQAEDLVWMAVLSVVRRSPGERQSPAQRSGKKTHQGLTAWGSCHKGRSETPAPGLFPGTGMWAASVWCGPTPQTPRRKQVSA